MDGFVNKRYFSYRLIRVITEASLQFRLRRSGSKNVIYIIEEISMTSESFSKYEEATESAIASTQVVDGYFVKRTQKVDDTIRYLARMTMLLKSMYEVSIRLTHAARIG